MPERRDPFPHLWFPFTYYEDVVDTPPVVIERGEGVWLYGADGKPYLDAVGSWWVSLLGHKHPEIDAAVAEQLGRLEHAMMAGFITPAAQELAERMGRVLPDELTRVFYSDNGSTAVEVAMKIALQYWYLEGEARTEFVAFGGAYHGDTLGAMAVGGIPAYHGIFHETFERARFTDPPSCYRCPVGREPETCGAECMDSLEAILREDGDRVAAVVFEPMVQGAAGMRTYPAKVLDRVFELCEAHGVLTIADEVAMGWGRTGRMFATEHAGRVPDLMAVAKGLTGGYLPLAATAVKEPIFDAFRGTPGSDRIFRHGHTFTGNPLAAAAANATLDILEREDIPRSLADEQAAFTRGIQSFRDIEAVGDARHIGMVGALELVADRETKAPFDADLRVTWRIFQRGLEHGVILRPLGDVLYFIPAYVISEDEMDEMFARARRAITEVLDEVGAG
ncbi:MAG: adenosylmethionine--8-amino-7-oxononanoate transaminase [Myxococcota bacterium]